MVGYAGILQADAYAVAKHLNGSPLYGASFVKAIFVPRILMAPSIQFVMLRIRGGYRRPLGERPVGRLA
jgi:hypothetical protein